MSTSDRHPAARSNLPSPEATEALRLSEEKFAKTFHISPDAILISSVVDGRIIDANDSFFRITGYTRDEVIGRPTEEIKRLAQHERSGRAVSRPASQSRQRARSGI